MPPDRQGLAAVFWCNICLPPDGQPETTHRPLPPVRLPSSGKSDMPMPGILVSRVDDVSGNRLQCGHQRGKGIAGFARFACRVEMKMRATVRSVNQRGPVHAGQMHAGQMHAGPAGAAWRRRSCALGGGLNNIPGNITIFVGYCKNSE